MDLRDIILLKALVPSGGGSGGGGDITVDSALSSTSENPVQNKAIYTALGNKANTSSVPSAYTSTPAALGTGAAGSSTSYAKGDHVHPKPSAADIGAIAAPANPSNGDFLCWNGTAWAATAVPAANGQSF